MDRKYNFWRLSKNNIKKSVNTKTTYKILVTGGLGYIGSHVVVELQNIGFEVVIIDDLSNSSLDVLDRIVGITGIKPVFEKIDLKEKKSVVDFFKKHGDTDGIIHFAASKAVGESVDNPLKYYENNIHSLVYLLQEINKLASQKLIFSSSCTVYGQADKLPISEQAQIKEPESPYGNTKKIGEQIIRDTCNISIEAKRVSKEIGSSLEANLKISLSEKLFKITEKTNFSELCITSDAKIEQTESGEVTAITTKAEGAKCPVCWKINKNGCERHPV